MVELYTTPAIAHQEQHQVGHHAQEDIPETAEMFSTGRNLCMIFAFQVFSNLGMVLGFGIGLVLYVGIKGMSIQAMANAYLLSFLASTMTQLYVGYLCDQPTDSKYGRRKPFVIKGFALSAISLVLLTMPPSDDGTALAGWFTLFYITFGIGQATMTNPLSSWFIESSRDSQDYLRITTLCLPPALFVGGVLAIASIVSSPMIGSAVSLVFGMIALYALVTNVPNPVVTTVEKLPEIIPSVRIAYKTPEFRMIFLNKVIEGAATGMYFSAMNYLLLVGFTQIQKVSDMVIYTLAYTVISGTVGLALVVACNWFLQGREKLTVFLNLTRALALMGLVSFFVSIFGDSWAFTTVYVIYLLVGVLSAPLLLVNSLFVRDLVVFDTFTTGLSRENLYLTAITVPTAIIISFLTAVPIILMTAAGYYQDVDDDSDDISVSFHAPPASVWVLRVFGPLALFFLGMAAYFLLKDYELSTEVAQQMSENIHAEMKNIFTGDTDAEATKSTAEQCTISDVKEEEHQLLLHFSEAELVAISGMGRSDEGTAVTSAAISRLERTSHNGVVMGAVSVLALLGALVCDVLYQQALVSTALVSVLTLCGFYTGYESLRLHRAGVLLLWQPDELARKAAAVHADSCKHQKTLKEQLKLRGIRVTDVDSVPAPESDQVAVDDVILSTEREGIVSYYYIFSGLSVAIIGASVTILLCFV